MNIPSLEALWLTNKELQIALEQVRERAYFKWQNAGSPNGFAQKFWDEAVLEWINYCYVPDRDWHYNPDIEHQLANGS